MHGLVYSMVDIRLVDQSAFRPPIVNLLVGIQLSRHSVFLPCMEICR